MKTLSLSAFITKPQAAFGVTLARLFFTTFTYSLFALALATVACVSVPLLGDPIELAQEQWDQCNRFPDVELVEITAQGQLLVRNKHTGFPPVTYLRCIQAVKYKQIL